MKKKKAIQYLSNKHLYGLMIHYKNEVAEALQNSKEPPQVPKAIGESIMLICNNLTKHPWYCGYSPQYKQEMVSDGILDCITAIDNFDPDKSNNPFAYFTQIAWNAFRRRIQKEKKQQYIKMKNYESSFVLNSDSDDSSWDKTQHKFNEITGKAIQEYEERYINKPAPTTPVAPKKKKGLERFLNVDIKKGK